MYRDIKFTVEKTPRTQDEKQQPVFNLSPNNNSFNIYKPSWNGIVLEFTRDIGSIICSNVKLTDENGQNVALDNVGFANDHKNALAMKLNTFLKQGKYYTLFIPANSLASKDGQIYKYDIKITFKA